MFFYTNKVLIILRSLYIDLLEWETEEKESMIRIIDCFIDDAQKTPNWENGDELFEKLRDIFETFDWFGVYVYIIPRSEELRIIPDWVDHIIDFFRETLASIKEEDFPDYVNEFGLHFNSPCDTQEGFLATENRHEHFYLYKILKVASEEFSEILYS